MGHYTCTCEDIAERVYVFGLFVDVTKYPINQLSFTTYIPTALQREEFAICDHIIVRFLRMPI